MVHYYCIIRALPHRISPENLLCFVVGMISFLSGFNWYIYPYTSRWYWFNIDLYLLVLGDNARLKMHPALVMNCIVQCRCLPTSIKYWNSAAFCYRMYIISHNVNPFCISYEALCAWNISWSEYLAWVVFQLMLLHGTPNLSSLRLDAHFNMTTIWIVTLIARFMGPTWGPSGADRIQVGPMLAPWTLLSGK